MEWIYEMIRPIIEDCDNPIDARQKVIEWGKNQEPRDAALGLIAVDFLNEKFIEAIDKTTLK